MDRQGPSGTPISNQGTVKSNAAIDTTVLKRRRIYNGEVLYFASRDTADYSARKHELAFFVHDEHNKTMVPPGLMAPQLKVVTSLNSLACVTGKVKDVDHTRNRITFVGINDTDYDASKVGEKSDHSSVTVAGSVTVHNNGTKRVRVGDTIVWDIPPFDDGNYDMRTSTKRRLVLRPIKGVAEFFHTGVADVASPAYLNHVLQLVEAYSEERSRIVGKALTNATEGQHFDLLLGYTHG